jgi:hypothetical protein
MALIPSATNHLFGRTGCTKPAEVAPFEEFSLKTLSTSKHNGATTKQATFWPFCFGCYDRPSPTDPRQIDVVVLQGKQPTRQNKRTPPQQPSLHIYTQAHNALPPPTHTGREMALRPVLRVRNRGEKGKGAGGENAAWKEDDKVRVWRGREGWRGE